MTARGRFRRRGAGLSLAVLIVLSLVPQQGALTNPQLWLGTVPALVYDGMGPELLPSAVVGGSVLEQSIGFEHGSYIRELMVDDGVARSDLGQPLAEAVANLPRVDAAETFNQIGRDTLSEAQHRLLEEGQRLSDSIEQIRAQLMDETTLASDEKFRMLQEFWQRYARLNDIQAQFSDKWLPPLLLWSPSSFKLQSLFYQCGYGHIYTHV